MTLKFALVTADEGARIAALQLLLPPHRTLQAVAIDGPLALGLTLVARYRAAEALLSKGVMQRRGKPGPTSSPTAPQLHRHATALVKLCQQHATIATATHFQPIVPKRIVEAFPNVFLLALLNEQAIPALNRDASDRFWEVSLSGRKPLQHFFNRLLPGRSPNVALADIRHHDKRAGLICALTALTVVRSEQISVGGSEDGDIMLPPLVTWGASAMAGEPKWLQRELSQALRYPAPANRNPWRPRIATALQPWLTPQNCS